MFPFLVSSPSLHMILTLVSSTSFLDDCEVLIATKGGIGAIIWGMKEYPTQADIQEKGSGALWTLAVNCLTKASLYSLSVQ
jgi:hypothetical protein